MLNLPSMRTLPQAAKELATADPATCLTLPVLRRMVKEGIIPAVYSGTRALVDMKTISNHLIQPATEEFVIEKIRRVDEKMSPIPFSKSISNT